MPNLHRPTVILVPLVAIEMVFVGRRAFSEKIFVRNISIINRTIVCKVVKYLTSFSTLKITAFANFF